MSNKTTLDDFKSCMDVVLVERTAIFLTYGLDGVIVLREIFQKFLSLINSILKKCFLLPPQYLFTEKTLPLKTGSLVSRVFENYVYYYAQSKSQRLYYN